MEAITAPRSGILGLITARGGSKGIPGKNVKPLAGKPLIAWTIQAALDSGVVDRLVVTTDDPAIARVAVEWGAQAPFLRPAAIAGDQATSQQAVAHALDWLREHEGYEPEWVLLLQPTSPLRAARDIRAAAELLAASGAQGVIGLGPASEHPWLTKRLDADGRLRNFVDPPAGASLRRQDLPPAHVINGAIYIFQTQGFRQGGDWWNLDLVGYIMPAERSVDIDDLTDWRRAEELLASPRS